MDPTPSTTPGRPRRATRALEACWYSSSAAARTGLGRRLADLGVPTRLVAGESEAHRWLSDAEGASPRVLLVDVRASRELPRDLLRGAAACGVPAVGVVLSGASSVELARRAPELEALVRPPITAERLAECLRKRARSRPRPERPEPIAHELVACLARVAAEADPGNLGHGQRTADYALGVARHLGWAPDRCERLRIAALLHDLGKARVSRDLLLKPSRLEPEEFAEVQRHAEIGAFLLEPLRAIPEVLQAARHHHERLDGSGYPDGLAGDAIPEAVRLVSVADVFDSLTARRPYRNPMPLERALDVLRESAGSHLDPDLVAAFEDWLAASLRA